MRHKPKPKGTIIAALDIGSTKIACFIGRVTDEQGGVSVIGIGHVASRGVKAGTVTDLLAAEESIRQAVHAAETMAVGEMKGYPLRDVVTGVPTMYTESHKTAIDIAMLGHEVGEGDIRRAIQRAQKQDQREGRTLIHAIAAGYAIDGHRGIEEPRGMAGQRLRVDVNVVTAESPALVNIARCVERTHLDIEALCVPPYAAGLSSLVADEMDLGCTVIDMGGGVTSFAVFREGAMIHAGAIPVGGAHVTNDVARGLNTRAQEAERIKILYGSALTSSTDDSELIDVPQLGEEEESQPNHIPRSYLVSIIQPRLEEVFEMVRARLDDSGLSAAMGRRVVLTGGAAQTPGMRDLAGMILGKQVRLGRPVRIKGLPDATSGPAFAATAGLLHYVCERADELPQYSGRHDAAEGTLVARAQRWLRENW
ncbi:MAG: cell division protein FtsA [Rhodospirillales bacterium]|nr:cell division protein FtsA [Alphaproteobacteria bacterium]MCB9986994.1 cell division protein FtsA [Rhodospirillales bacterium]USO08576.1 MAG: cell division protein FtsA [Rhodospirillales bacterium]